MSKLCPFLHKQAVVAHPFPRGAHTGCYALDRWTREEACVRPGSGIKAVPGDWSRKRWRLQVNKSLWPHGLLRKAGGWAARDPSNCEVPPCLGLRVVLPTLPTLSRGQSGVPVWSPRQMLFIASTASSVTVVTICWILTKCQARLCYMLGHSAHLISTAAKWGIPIL